MSDSPLESVHSIHRGRLCLLCRAALVQWGSDIWKRDLGPNTRCIIKLEVPSINAPPIWGGRPTAGTSIVSRAPRSHTAPSSHQFGANLVAGERSFCRYLLLWGVTVILHDRNGVKSLKINAPFRMLRCYASFNLLYVSEYNIYIRVKAWVMRAFRNT